MLDTVMLVFFTSLALLGFFGLAYSLGRSAGIREGERRAWREMRGESR